ncbi:VRR-NUC domain-containing protein [Endozoicomonas montiporae]|uniref:VRR-NUC domain-containing protein n=1 Tax=Endozoicomonas montiporae CL-33 TaxID=570277 RepID=A0A142BHA8_9GAMM|nr:VRR-NUC domain-containing protein [Endozoicomonas montiporae]AMO58134.1 VRR-NUC domain-containing protein [Endozoicomonas montiporae CL-33]
MAINADPQAYKKAIAKKFRKPAVDREGSQQKLFFDWLRFTHPDVYKHTFHIPNGGQRSGKAGAKMKREGVKRGVPDIMVALSNGQWPALFIEFKAAKPYDSSVKPEQKEWLERLNKAGYLAVVCKGVAEAKKAITDYLMADEVPY